MKQKGTTANTHYKDRLFRFIFGNAEWKENTLDLYNALNGTDYKDPGDLEITTIEDIIYLGMKNDVSFIINDVMSLYEQQSTYNPNMPVRGLMYFAKLYDKFIVASNLNVYGTKLLSLPTPKYVVLYNGQDKSFDRMELKLTDSFPEESRGSSDLQVTATMININEETEDELLTKCKLLNDYSIFVGKVRNGIENGMAAEDAVEEAMNECIKEDVLAKILRSHKSEVMEMVITEYDAAAHEALVREEGRAAGLEQGLQQGREQGLQQGREQGLQQGREQGLQQGKIEEKKAIAAKMRENGVSVQDIATYTGLTVEEIEALA